MVLTTQPPNTNGANGSPGTNDNGESDVLSLWAETVTGTRELHVEVRRGLKAGDVARSIADRLSLPDDVAWALRDERSAFLDEGRAIGDQLGPQARVTITPRTHLGASH